MPATNFGYDEEKALHDIHVLADAIDAPVLMYKGESGRWWGIPSAEMVKQDLNFPYKIVKPKENSR